jgi:hypothetical protein
LSVPGIIRGVIVPYVGTKASLLELPDWRYVDGTGGTPFLYASNSVDIRQPRIAFTNLGIGGAFGVLTHSHSTGGHIHTVATHIHTITNDVAGHTRRIVASGTGYMRHSSSFDHSNKHVWTVAAGSITIVSGYEANSWENNRTPYLEVLFAEYLGERIILKGGVLMGGVIGA